MNHGRTLFESNRPQPPIRKRRMAETTVTEKEDENEGRRTRHRKPTETFRPSSFDTSARSYAASSASSSSSARSYAASSAAVQAPSAAGSVTASAATSANTGKSASKAALSAMSQVQSPTSRAGSPASKADETRETRSPSGDDATDTLLRMRMEEDDAGRSTPILPDSFPEGKSSSLDQSILRTPLLPRARADSGEDAAEGAQMPASGAMSGGLNVPVPSDGGTGTTSVDAFNDFSEPDNSSNISLRALGSTRPGASAQVHAADHTKEAGGGSGAEDDRGAGIAETRPKRRGQEHTAGVSKRPRVATQSGGDKGCSLSEILEAFGTVSSSCVEQSRRTPRTPSSLKNAAYALVTLNGHSGDEQRGCAVPTNGGSGAQHTSASTAKTVLSGCAQADPRPARTLHTGMRVVMAGQGTAAMGSADTGRGSLESDAGGSLTGTCSPNGARATALMGSADDQELVKILDMHEARPVSKVSERERGVGGTDEGGMEVERSSLGCPPAGSRTNLGSGTRARRKMCAQTLSGKGAQSRSQYFQESEDARQWNGGEDSDGRSAVCGLSEDELEQIDDNNGGARNLKNVLYSGDFAIWQLYRGTDVLESLLGHGLSIPPCVSSKKARTEKHQSEIRGQGNEKDAEFSDDSVSSVEVF
jgi:hypothetical protein